MRGEKPCTTPHPNPQPPTPTFHSFFPSPDSAKPHSKGRWFVELIFMPQTGGVLETALASKDPATFVQSLAALSHSGSTCYGGLPPSRQLGVWRSPEQLM